MSLKALKKAVWEANQGIYRAGLALVAIAAAPIVLRLSLLWRWPVLWFVLLPAILPSKNPRLIEVGTPHLRGGSTIS